MKSAIPLKVWLVFTGVFLAGGVTGGFVALRIADRIVEKGRASGQFAPRLLNHLTERLELSAAQRAELKVMVDAAWSQLRVQRRASRDTMQALDRQIVSILTPEQQVVYAELQASHRQRWQSESGDRRGDPSRRGPPEGGPPRPDGRGPPPESDAPPPGR